MRSGQEISRGSSVTTVPSCFGGCTTEVRPANPLNAWRQHAASVTHFLRTTFPPPHRPPLEPTEILRYSRFGILRTEERRAKARLSRKAIELAAAIALVEVQNPLATAAEVASQQTLKVVKSFRMSSEKKSGGRARGRVGARARGCAVHAHGRQSESSCTRPSDPKPVPHHGK